MLAWKEVYESEEIVVENKYIVCQNLNLRQEKREEKVQFIVKAEKKKGFT